MGGDLEYRLLNTDGTNFSSEGLSASKEPMDAAPLPPRQETIRSLSKQAAAQAGPYTPVIASPFGGRRKGAAPRSKATRRRLFNQVLISCIILFTEGFYGTQLFPYGPSMTEALRGTTANAGVCTGLLFTAQSCGMLSTAYLWATFSNRYGRKVCLLTGLATNLFLTLIMSVTTDYWFMIALRLISGLMNSNLAIMRTALRETFHYEEEDDTQAFATLSVAFGASSVCGPSWGGLVYGLQLPFGEGWLQPWSASLLTSTVMYIICLVATATCFQETAFLQKPFGEKLSSSPGKRPPRGLLKDFSFVLLLIMAGGHSYIFTGWEIAYPLIARVPAVLDGQGWSTAAIGTTFVAGSSFLMIYSMVVYPWLAKKTKVIRIWVLQAGPPLMAYLLFPRLIVYLCGHGDDGHSPGVFVLNYICQAVISMLFGSGFISIQLLINSYVSRMPNSGELLALANSMLASTQALVRAVSPLMTGGLFTLGLRSEEDPDLKVFLSRSLPFDVLAVIGLLSVVLAALTFERRETKGDKVRRTSPVY